MPTLLLIDPHPVTRHGIASAVRAGLPGAVIAEAATFHEAIVRLRTTRPALVLADFQIDGESVLTFLPRLDNHPPPARCLVVSAAGESTCGAAAIRAGAAGFLPKSASLEDLSAAIHAVLDGRTWISGPLAKALANGAATASAIHWLTRREQEIFTLIGQGQTCAQIAAHLGLATKSVESHREHIKSKLHLENAAQVTAAASRWLHDASMYEI